jgi:hypothetical protein
MSWVYYWRLVDTKFQAECLAARFEDSQGWTYRKVPKYVGIFQTPKGKYGIKVLW